MRGYYVSKDVNGDVFEAFWLPRHFYSSGFNREFRHTWDICALNSIDGMFGNDRMREHMESIGFRIKSVEINDNVARKFIYMCLNPKSDHHDLWRWIDNILEYVLINMDLDSSPDTREWWRKGEKPYGEAWH